MKSYGTAGIDTRAPRKAPTLWAIGGGKGGVGKTVVSSGLAIGLAQRGHRTAVIDLDLGAANLHSLLGVAAPRFTLSDFLNRKVPDLSEILCPTPFANLHLASGARASLDMANPKHFQKEKLLRHIRSLDVDHVVLDLSAGCAFNALDFFLAAERGIAVVIPERTSIENTQNFLKTAFFRSLRKVAQEEPLRSLMKEVLNSGRVRSARDLIRGVAEVDAELGSVLARHAAAFSPTLVVNQLESSVQRRECNEIALACRHYLSAGVRECGVLPRDQRVRDAVSEGQHVLALYPGARFSVALDSLAAELLKGMAAPRAAASGTAVSLHSTTPVLTSPFEKSESELPPLGSFAPGAYLRRCREQRGLSLSDVGRRTRIRNLAGIENERFEELPPESYVAAFVRQYARLLGIGDFERLTRCYVQRYRAARIAG